MGGICIVKPIPQWYIDYANYEWKNNALKCVESMKLHEEVKKKIIQSITELREWGVSRPFGLGTKLPMDNDLIIDSLSDSTIYPAYYTISHLIQKDLYGKISKYKSEQFTDEIWDFIFLGKEIESKISCEFNEDIEIMKKTFEYFYPVDMRISGKDLINNHLAMYIYNHVAIFDKKYYPISINCNGWILVDGKKMGKSLGNFITIENELKENSIDAVRMTLADSGDNFNDANYVKANAGEHSVLKLFSWIETIEKYSKEKAEIKIMNSVDLMFEQIFKRFMNNIIENYNNQKYKPVITEGFHEWNSLREKYRIYSKYFNNTMNQNLLKLINELQVMLLYPIMPHITSHIWKNIFKKNTNISKCIYKDYIIQKDVNNELIDNFELMEELITISRTKIERAKKKKTIVNNIKISVNTTLINDFMKKIVNSQLKQNIIWEHHDLTNIIIIIQ
jgi:leucyl-tRNA synthetase